MKKYSILAFVFLSLFMLSCASEHIYKGVKMYKDAQGNLLCGLHHKPLIKKHGFRPYPPTYCVAEESAKWSEAFPNNGLDFLSYQEHESCKREVYYDCLACDEALKEKLN